MPDELEIDVVSRPVVRIVRDALGDLHESRMRPSPPELQEAHVSQMTLQDGAVLRYEDRGRGRPLVLLHGVWMSLASPASSSRRSPRTTA